MRGFFLLGSEIKKAPKGAFYFKYTKCFLVLVSARPVHMAMLHLLC